MSFVQLQAELKKLSTQEKLALADYLVRDAEAMTEPSAGQLAELDRRFAEAVAHPETLVEPGEELRHLKR
jgi:hypothetical protein